VIQMSSSLRNLGRPEESVALLTAELDAGRTTWTTPYAPSSRWP
jgi:Tetratrico peptide repeat